MHTLMQSCFSCQQRCRPSAIVHAAQESTASLRSSKQASKDWVWVLQVRASFVERFSMGAPYSGGQIHGPAFSDVAEKVDWVEKFVRLGTQVTEAARSEHDRCCCPLLPSRAASCSLSCSHTKPSQAFSSPPILFQPLPCNKGRVRGMV
jgi:hypothetical protein